MMARSPRGASSAGEGAMCSSGKLTYSSISNGLPISCMPCNSSAARYDGAVRIAVVGGGINGLGVAWELARRDYDVTLLEKGRCGAQTSANTTKLIHGGIRYLERGHVGLVREALRERAWLLEHLPQLVHPLEFLLPVYDDSPRMRATLSFVLTLYDALAGGANIERHRKLSASEIAARAPLTSDKLRGGFRYWDAQTDDFAMARAV